MGSTRELREEIQNCNNTEIHDFLSQKGIDWSSNPLGAAHHGGIWEGQIRSVRKQSNAICQEQLLADESLITLMCEVEAINHSRYD